MEKEAIFSYNINREKAQRLGKPEILISAYNMDTIGEYDYARINYKFLRYMENLEEYNFVEIVGNLFQIFEELDDYNLTIILKQADTTHKGSFSGPHRNHYTCEVDDKNLNFTLSDDLNGHPKIKCNGSIDSVMYGAEYFNWCLRNFYSTVDSLRELAEKYNKEEPFTKELLF